MGSVLNRANEKFEALPDKLRRHRILVWVLFIVCNIAMFLGASRFTIDMSIESYFQQEDPAKQAFDRFRLAFGGDEVLLLVFEAKNGKIFTNESLEAIGGLQNAFIHYRLKLAEGETSMLDHITDVKSIVNASYMEATESALYSRPFIGDQLPASEDQLAEWKKNALAHAEYPKRYISLDGRYGAIVLRTDFNAKVIDDIRVDGGTQSAATNESPPLDTEDAGNQGLDDEELAVSEWGAFDDQSWEQASINEPSELRFTRTEIEEYKHFIDEIRPLLAKKEFADHLEFYMAGYPPTMAFFSDVIMKEMAMIALSAIVIIGIALWFLFRSLSAVVWSSLIVIISMLWIVGLVGWSGMVMTFMINIIVFLILAVGVADAVHILSGYLYFRNHGEDHERALRSVFKKSGLACLLTSLTTAMGLCALLFVPVVPIQNFGLFAALGVFIAFLLTVFMLPLMLDIWAPKPRHVNDTLPASKQGQQASPAALHPMQSLLRKVETVGYNQAMVICLIFLCFSSIMMYGITKIRVDSNIIEIIPEDSELRRAFDTVDAHLGGAQSMEIIIDAGSRNALKHPQLLNDIEELQEYLYREHGDIVGKVTSIVTVVKDAYQTLNEGQPQYFTIPQDPEVLAQTLFLFNNANVSDRRQLVADDYSQARMSISFKNAGSYVYNPIIDDIQGKANTVFNDSKALYPDLKVTLTGAISLMMKLMEYISWSQIKSFGLALTVISAILFFTFGSLKIGVIAIVPNLLPTITAFGLMGYAGMSLDTDTLLVAPIIIGIAVDDTIHFLTHYRAGMLATGSVKKAIIQTVREAGQAITFTSIVLSLGFLVFVLSSHMSLRNFGILSAVAISTALIADLLLLPALCKLFNANFSRLSPPLKEKHA